MKALHQLVAGYSNGDAISNEARVMRDIFRNWGFESDIFCETNHILPELRTESRPLTEAADAVNSDDVFLLHLSIGSPANDTFLQINCRKALLYHNVTPPDFFRGINEQIASSLARGIEDVKRLAGAAEVNLADSRFNAHELEAAGYKKVQVLPLVLDLERLRKGVSRKVLHRYHDGLTNVLFVGRCAPNKRLEDCLAAFHYFQKYVEPASRFIHAGSFAGTEQYQSLLTTVSRDLGLDNIDILSSIPQDELNACYQSAHVFLCMSEHEGFCIPVVEAMVHDLPVLAYDCAAVPETLDGAGVLFNEKRYDLIAEMMGHLARSGPFRDEVIAGQRHRIERYESRNLNQELKNHLAPLISSRP